jgi:hypothetical protein
MGERDVCHFDQAPLGASARVHGEAPDNLLAQLFYYPLRPSDVTKILAFIKDLLKLDQFPTHVHPFKALPANIPTINLEGDKNGKRT